jgi:hypothetical protein
MQSTVRPTLHARIQANFEKYTALKPNMWTLVTSWRSPAHFSPNLLRDITHAYEATHY